jgi:hypothetical protein
MAKVLTNHSLSDLIREAGYQKSTLARQVNHAGRQRGLALRYDGASIYWWLRGRVPEPPVSELICEVLGRKLGRPVDEGSLGFHPPTERPGQGLELAGGRKISDHAVAARSPLANPTSGLSFAQGARLTLDSAVSGTSIDPGTVDRWESVTQEFICRYQKSAPGGLFSEIVVDLAEMGSLLAGRQPWSQRRRLIRSAAQMALLAGIFLAAMGQPRESRSWFHTAGLAAGEADDPALAGTAVARSATVAYYYGSPESAAELARRAQFLLGKHASASRVRALMVEARARVRLGQDTASVRTIIREAEGIFNELSPEETGSVALGFTERQLWFTAGTAYSHLGLTKEASVVQDRALGLYRTTEHLDPALIRLDQAAGLLRVGDAEQGCLTAVQVLRETSEQHRPGLVIHCARTIYQSLSPTDRCLAAAGDLREAVNVQRIPQ